jgi:hypothetical protein
MAVEAICGGGNIKRKKNVKNKEKEKNIKEWKCL